MSDSNNTIVTLSDLKKGTCRERGEGDHALNESQTAQFLRLLPGWEQLKGEIVRTYLFKNYYQTMAFVNAIAWISHQQNHHPELEVSYNKCLVRYSTHSVGGLSENDFMCAAKVDALLASIGK